MKKNENHDRETLGQRLQRLRSAAGFTQVHLARSADMPVASLRNYECDHREPTVRAACRLAAALGTTVEALIAGTVEIADTERTPRPAGPTRPRKR